MDNQKANSKSNQLKALSGSNQGKLIEKKLNLLKEEEIIKGFKVDENFKHVDFSYEKQFLANFVIETIEGKYIIVRSSTSFRSDRAKIGYYDLDGIIRYSDFSKNVIASVYLVPDEEIENKDFTNTRERIRLKEFYCPASHLLTFSEFVSFLDEYKYETLSQFEEEFGAIPIHNSVQDRGSFYGKRGNKYEDDLVKTLSDNRNLIQLKNSTMNKNHIYSIILNRLMKEEKIKLVDVIKLSATNSIPLLKNGGNPKTDIALTMETSDGNLFTETISVKNTSKDRVSCHDYTAKDYIRVLKCEGTRLEDYFLLFQAFPSYSDFEENLKTKYSIKEFKDLLIENADLFTYWVLTGLHDVENLVVPELQVSKYLLIRKGEKSAFYSMNEYIELIKNKVKSPKFGVPFSWTYPSKQRGKRIQLKVQIIF